MKSPPKSKPGPNPEARSDLTATTDPTPTADDAPTDVDLRRRTAPAPQDADALLDHPSQLTSHFVRADPNDTTAFRPRQTFGDRFEIVRPLGQGGMGAVYLARDTLLERNVAIKTLRTDHLSDDARAHWLDTFRREASSTARLQHPHITTLHDFGVEPPRDPTRPGIPFMVLEYLRGRTLSTMLRQRPLEVPRAVDLARQLATALAHAHQEGVIHRDIKPGNLFIQADDQLKVLDFGIAILHTDTSFVATPNPTDDPDDDTPGVVGTPLYMAPEQLLAQSQDARVDWWAFGVVLFEMLTGRRPFVRARQILSLPAPPLGGHVPESLVRLVSRCLQRDPNARPHRAVDVLSALSTLEARRSLTGLPALRTTNLPPPDDPFIGRRHELNTLHTLVDQHTHLITLLGPGGCGKTRLALAFGHAALSDFDGVFFCDLTEARDVASITQAFARTLDVPLTQRDPVTQLAHVLSRRGKLLVILDNFEQLVPFAPQTIAEWINQVPLTTFVVTSRHRLHLEHEHVLTLAPLPTPSDDTLDQIQDSDAVQLFVARAQAHARHFTLDDTNAHDVAALVRALDGLPLAIELAAARTRVLTPSKIVHRLNRRFDLLKSKRRDLNPRQATLEGALEWSWDLLEPWEQSALAQAAVFEGGFTLDAAEAVIDLSPWDDAPWLMHVLYSLVDKSLIRLAHPNDHLRVNVEPRFHLLETVQAFAHKKFRANQVPQASSDSGAVDVLYARHGDFFAQLGTPDALEKVHGFAGVAHKHMLALELDNLIAAVARALDAGRDAVAYRAILAAFEVFVLQGPFHAALEHITHVLDRTTLDRASQGTLLQRRATLFARAGDPTRARADYEQALVIASDHGDRRQQCICIGSIASIDQGRGNTDAAREGFSRALALATNIDDTRLRSSWLGCRASLDIMQGRFDEAMTQLNNASELAAEIGDRRQQGYWHINIANIDLQQGRTAEARERYKLGLQVAERIGDRRLEAFSLDRMAMIDTQDGQLEHAREAYRRVLALARLTGDRFNETQTRAHLASLDLTQGHWREAREGFQDALLIARQLDNPSFQGQQLTLLAHVEMALKRHNIARVHLTDAEALLRDISDSFNLAKLLCLRGQLDLAQSRPGDARAALNEAQRIADDLDVSDDAELSHEITSLRDALQHA